MRYPLGGRERRAQWFVEVGQAIKIPRRGKTVGVFPRKC